MQRAGTMTYLAFLLAQIGATIIALFGFGGYTWVPDSYDNCQFCTLSSGKPVSGGHKQW
jgi:H+-transporting ATPase